MLRDTVAGRLIKIRSAGRRQCAPSACVQVTAMLPPAPLLAAAQVHKCCQPPRSLSWPTARPTLLADRPAHPLVDRPAHPPGRKPRPPSVRSPRPPSCRPPSFLSYSYLHPLLFRHCDRHYPPHATAVADTIPRILSSLHGGGGESLYDGPDGVCSRLTSGGGDWVGIHTGAVWRV